MSYWRLNVVSPTPATLQFKVFETMADISNHKLLATRVKLQNIKTKKRIGFLAGGRVMEMLKT